MHKDSPNGSYAVAEHDGASGPSFTPFEMSILHALLASTAQPSLPIPLLLEKLSFYIKPMAGGGDDEYVAKMAVLTKALRDGGSLTEEGEVLTAETAAVLESNPSAFADLHLHIGASATPAAVEYLATNEKLTDEDHAAIARLLILLDTEKDGVFSLTLAFRELMRLLVPIMSTKGNEEPSAAAEESREITRRILNTASVNADAGYAISLSDFIEAYAMEVYVIPPQHRTIDTAALTRRIDLADYSLLWAAINNIRGIDAHHVEAALTEAAAVEGVVADECSLFAIIKTVTGFIEAEAEKGVSTDAAMQMIADTLVMNPTSLHIPVMAPEQRQEVAARKLLLYFRPSAVLSVLRALLLEDVRGDGVLSKPMAEAALMVELSKSSHGQAEGAEGGANVDEVEAFAGVDQSRVEEMIRNVLLSAGVADGGQEVNLSHFIDALIELTPVLPARYCAGVTVPMVEPAVQLNELEHLQQLLAEAIRKSGDALMEPMTHGCVALSTLSEAIDTALVSQSGASEAKEALLDAFKVMALNSASGHSEAFSDAGAVGAHQSPVDASLIDIDEALSVAVFETSGVTFNIGSLSDYHASIVASRRVAKGNIRKLAKAFILLDSDRSKRLTFEAFRDVMAANPKFASTAVLEAAFEAMDMDMDGALCLEEFISSFNHGPSGPALSGAQLSSFTTRRMSVKELHQGPSVSPPRGEGEEGLEGADGTAAAVSGEDAHIFAVAVAGAINSPSKKAAMLKSLAAASGSSVAIVSPDGSVVPSPHRRSTKSLAPHNDASGVPVDDADLRAEFERFDANGSGFIDRRQFAVAYRQMENYGLEPSDRDIEMLFSKVCGSRNIITFDEFSLLMLRRSRM